MEGAMEQLKSDPALSPEARWKVTRLGLDAVPPAHVSLMRGLDMAEDDGRGFGLLDVERAEAVWELLEGDSTAHGFVLVLRGGRRVYLQYVASYSDGEMDEEITTLSMGGDERYPPIQGGGIVWTDAVDRLNGLLR
jgi:hypothetical protein